MRLDTAASYSTRHSDLLAEAHAARVAGSSSIGLGRLFRKAGEQLSTGIAEARAARLVQSPAKAAARS